MNVFQKVLALFTLSMPLIGCSGPTFYEYASDARIEKLSCPIDCDFDAAPFGKKGCHYEKRIALLNAQGLLIGGDNVLPNGDHVYTSPKEPVISVFVTWVKIDDAEAYHDNHTPKEQRPGSPDAKP
jgi:hypothetical protein